MFLKMKTKQSMNNSYHNLPNGYQITIQNGLRVVRNFSGQMYKGIKLDQDTIELLAKKMQSLLVLVRDCLHLQALHIVGNDLKSTSLILRLLMVFKICILVDFIHFRIKKSFGHGGQDISTLIVM